MDAVRRMRLCALALGVMFIPVTGLNIRNEQLGKCVQVQESIARNSLTLEECKAGSALQEWRWDPRTLSLQNPLTDKCLTAVRVEEQGSVGLEVCRMLEEDEEEEEEEEGQAWSCSKKGHLTLHGKGFHLSAHHDSSKIFLSMERGKSSKWRTLSKQTVCDEEAEKTDGLQNEPEKPGPQIIAKIRLWQAPMNPAPNPTQPAQIVSAFTETNSSMELDPSLIGMEYGMGWKVTMLVLTSLALVLGTVILILNIYQNRRRKTVVVLKSYSSMEEASQPGSPVPGERAPLTQNPMQPPRSPSIQRGEILVEWKDGTVTPLFNTYLAS